MRLRLPPPLVGGGGGPERETPFLERVRPCLRAWGLVVVEGLPMAPVLVMWFAFALSAPPWLSETLRECAGCHLELLLDLRGRVLRLPVLPVWALYVASLRSSLSISPAASSSSSSSSSSPPYEAGTS